MDPFPRPLQNQMSKALYKKAPKCRNEKVEGNRYERRENCSKSDRKVSTVSLTVINLQIYATSEERKQRNRQAQAAFRERRTEYIKQLETTIKHHEDTLQNLQQSHRSAADECLMLRYKNSLLERILVEKGKGKQVKIFQDES